MVVCQGEHTRTSGGACARQFRVQHDSDSRYEPEGLRPLLMYYCFIAPKTPSGRFSSHTLFSTN